MTSRSPSAFLLSAIVHGAAVGLLFFFGLEASHPEEEQAKVIELVAGAGDNYAATVAPALGLPDGLKIKTADPAPLSDQPEEPLIKAPPVTEPTPVPTPEPTPAPPEPAPEATPPPDAITPAPVDTPKPAPKPKPAATTAARKPVDLVKVLKRREAARAAYLEKKYQKKLAAQRAHDAAVAKLRAAGGHGEGRIDAAGIREGVVGGSTDNSKGGAGGHALSREEADALDAYFAFLKQKLHDNFIPPEGVSDKLEPKVELYLAADGSLSHVRIVRSSGNPAFDQAVLEAFSRTHGIGPRPDGRGETITILFSSHNDDTN